MGARRRDQIAAVDGIDALFIGPQDSACDLVNLSDHGYPEVQAAIADAIAARFKPGGT